MNLKFKIYRVISAVVLIISGFFSFMGLSSVLFMGFNVIVLLSLMAWGACFIHSVLSIYLQRSLIMPEISLKESTPGGIRIMGVMVMLFSLMMIFVGFALLAAAPEMITEATKQLPADQRAIIRPGILKPIGIFCLVTGIIFTLHASFSFEFLRRWQERKKISSGKNSE